MADIKSAYEIAMEKINKIESATTEEKMQWKFIPKGEELAGKYLKDDINLAAELAKYSDQEKKYVVQGITAILARNIDLPKNDAVKKNNKKAMDGLSAIKKDKKVLENVFSKIRYIFNHYSEQGEAQKKEAYEQVKEQFMMKLQQAMQQQGTAARMNPAEVERLPQFQEEWRKMLTRLDSQYIQHLSEYKHELLALN
jgi:exonuclease III